MFLPRLISTVLFVTLITVLVTFRWSTPTFALISIISLFALWEFYRLQESKGLRVFKKAGAFGALLYLLSDYFKWVKPGVFGTLENVEAFTFLLIILGVMGRMVFERERETPVATIALTVFGFFYIPYLFSYVSKIIFISMDGTMSGVILAAYLIAVTKCTDIGAYLVGVRVGRHQMSPDISPKKTWEGFAAGMLSGLMCSFLMVWLLPGSLGVLSWIHALVLGLMIPLVSVLGDLAESVVKRDANIKDSGGFIPGIGGSLDLIDSLLYTAPLFYFYLVFAVGL
ncbi:MAG: phosphatidate cytidylyltransferase [Candidatus Methylacidiphilales bacterium]